MNYKNLLISGGGIYGISIIGIINSIKDYNILNNIEKYLGTSVGSIICLLLNINYDIDELYKFLKIFNLQLIVNKSDQSINLFDNLLNKYGFNNTKNLKLILENFLIGKNLNKNITLKELFLITKKELIINVSCLNDWSNIYFSYKNYPDIKVVDIITASCSIPIIFEPTKINDKYYVDGGFYNNRPVDFFKDELNETFIITHSIILNNFVNFNNFESYLYNLLKSKLDNNELKTIYKLTNLKNVIIYNRNSDISPIHFYLSKEDIDKLYNLGYEFGLKYIKKNYYYEYFTKKKNKNINIY